MIARRAAVGAGAAVALAAGAALAAAPAWAAPSTQIVQSAVLRIVSVADWSEAADLVPGESVQWDVAVSADADAEPGTVTLAVSATGAAPCSLTPTSAFSPGATASAPAARRCSRRRGAVPRDGSEAVLADFPSTQTAHLRLRMAMSGDGDRPGFTDVRVSARGVGDAVVAGVGGGLPATGGTAPVGALIGGGALVGAGAVLLTGRIRRRGRVGGEERGGRAERDRRGDAEAAP